MFLSTYKNTLLSKGLPWYYKGSALDLDFANQRAYNSMLGFPKPDDILTYTAPNPKLVCDASGTLVYAPHNLLTYSEQFDNAAWSKTAAGTGSVPVVTPNVAVAPDGTTTADLIAFDRGAGNTASDQSQIKQVTFSGSTGQRYTGSVWIKAATVSDVGKQLALRHVGGSSFKVITLTADWVRETVTETHVSNNFEITNRGTITVDNAVSAHVWGAQLSLGSSALAYIPTTSAAIYRLPYDYNPTTHAALGVLIEEQRTNLLTYSEQFDNAAWSKSNATVSANAASAPDGTTTADKLIESASSAYHNLNRALGSTSPQQTLAYSVYAKASERSNIFLRMQESSAANYVDGYFDLSDLSTAVTNGGTGTGATATIQDVGGGWYRCVLVGRPSASTGTGTTPAIALTDTNDNTTYAGDGTSGVYIWGAQLEAGAFPTSYIPTVASQVTRAADQVIMATSAFAFNALEGTLVGEASWGPGSAVNPNSSFVAAFSEDASSQERIILYNIGGEAGYVIQDGGVTQAAYNSPDAIPPGVFAKLAVAYKENDTNGAVDGVASSTDTSCTMPVILKLTVGASQASSSAGHINGHIKRLTYFPTRKPDSELITLTI